MKIVQHNKSPRKYNKNAIMNRIHRDDSAFSSLSVLDTAIPKCRKTAESYRQQKKSHNNTVLLRTDAKKDNKSEMSSSFLIQHLVKTTEKEVTRRKILDQSIVFPMYVEYQDSTLKGQYSDITFEQKIHTVETWQLTANI